MLLRRTALLPVIRRFPVQSSSLLLPPSSQHDCLTPTPPQLVSAPCVDVRSRTRRWLSTGPGRATSAASDRPTGVSSPVAPLAEPCDIVELGHRLNVLASSGSVEGCIEALFSWRGSDPIPVTAYSTLLSAVVYRCHRGHCSPQTPVVLQDVPSVPEGLPPPPDTFHDLPEWVSAMMAANETPRTPTLTYFLIVTNAYLGRLGEASKLLHRALALDPDAGGLATPAKACSILLRKMLQRRMVTDATELLEAMEEAAVELDSFAYALLIKASVRYHEPALALRFLALAQASAGKKREDLTPEVWDAALVAATALDDVEAIDTVTDVYRQQPDYVTINTFNTLKRHYLKTMTPLEALEAARSALGPGSPPPDVGTFVQLMDAYVEAGQNHKVGPLFTKMEEMGLQPNVPAFTVLLKAHANQGNLDRCDLTIAAMRSRGFVPTITVVNSLMSVHIFHGKPIHALSLLSLHMREDGVVPDRVTTKIFALSLAGAGHLDEAFGIIHRARHLLSRNERLHCLQTVMQCCAAILDPGGARPPPTKWLKPGSSVPHLWLYDAPARHDAHIIDWLPDVPGRYVFRPGSMSGSSGSQRRAAVVLQKAARGVLDAKGTVSPYLKQLLVQRKLWFSHGHRGKSINRGGSRHASTKGVN